MAFPPEFVPEIIFTNGQSCSDVTRRIYMISRLQFTSCTSVDLWDKRSMTFDKCIERFCEEVTANVVTYTPAECNIQTCTSITQATSSDSNEDTYGKISGE